MTSLFRRLLPKPVANTGSQLRDHQANERTFLSWTRMGLAFAAMGLAFGRLGLIEHLFNPRATVQLPQVSQVSQVHSTSTQSSGQSTDPKPEHTLKNYTPSSIGNSPDLVASRLCQAISVWSFGYGLFRYISVRRNLGKGQFVPAIWGPVLMTFGTFGVVGSV
ncbi:hypothetical protein P175DRAFT_0425132, partial [Aspergillus ochraceoroseus IBT 24754]